MNRFLFLLALSASLAGAATREPVAPDPISIDVKDASLPDVLRLFSRLGDVNLVLDPAVSGKTITLRLDEVPWDQALDLVLATHGLGSVLEGNVLRIAPVSKLVAENAQKVQLREAREQAGELRTIAVPLSHADATQVEALVRKTLGPRGSTMVDRRTNTLFVTEVVPGAAAGDLLLMGPAAPARRPAAAATSVGLDVVLFEISGDLPSSLSASDLGRHPQARRLDAARLVLGLEQRADLVLGSGPEARCTVSPQVDGSRVVLALRAAASDGSPVARAVATGREESVILPGRGGRTLVLAFVPGVV